MIRNETIVAGVSIHAETIDLTTGTYTVEDHGQIVEGPRPLTLQEWQRYGPQPLEPLGAAMTLLAVMGVLPVTAAANAVGLTADDLVAEAQAWAMGDDPDLP